MQLCFCCFCRGLWSCGGGGCSCLTCPSVPRCHILFSRFLVVGTGRALQLTKQRAVTYVLEELYHCQTYAANPLANHVLDLAFLLQPELSGITFIIAQVYLPVLRQTALLSPSASFSTPCSNNVPSLPATGLFSLVRDWFSVCAMLCSVKGERGSDHLWPGTGHYNKQRVTIQARLKGRQEVLVRTWVGFILIHVTYDRISLGSGGVILEHDEGHSRIEMDNLDISIQPGRGAVRRQSVFQGSSVIKL